MPDMVQFFIGFCVRNMSLVPFLGHGRSATAMAAYEGQSGSKDRGDPQVSFAPYGQTRIFLTEESF